MPSFTTPPSIDDVREMAERALERLPAALVARVRGVAMQVVDFPDEETQRMMACETPFDLLGLYWGVPFGERSVSDAPTRPDMIFLYRRPILDYWADSGGGEGQEDEPGEDLYHLVAHVLIHEIGHHFGLSDEDMEALEAEVE